MEYKYLLVGKDENGIVHLTINRPEKLNALCDILWFELLDYFTKVELDMEAKVVIITGAGDKAFAAGADIGNLSTKKPVDCLYNAAQRALLAIERCSKPVIAAVNGYAFGGGCELALACDFRIVSDTALFALPEAGLGIIPGAGGTQRLSRLIGMGRAKDMIMLGRKIDGEEAFNIGLASRCVPLEELMKTAEKTAAKLLSHGPVALALAKQLISYSTSPNLEQGLLAEKLALSTLCGTEDKNEGLSAFLEKRKPSYSGK